MIGFLISGFRRVVSAPGWIVALAAANLLFAKALGASVTSALSTVMGRWSIAEGEILYALLEILPDQSGLLTLVRQSLLASTVIGLLFWTLVAGGILARLKEPMPVSRVVGKATRSLPTVLVVTLWHLLFRGILLGVVGGIGALLGRLDAASWIAPVLGVSVLLYATCALDLARVHAVLHGARRFHPATALAGFTEAAQRPAVLLASMTLGLVRWVAVLAILWLTIDGISAGHGPWPARLLWIVALLCGLARMGVAVEAGAPRRGRG